MRIIIDTREKPQAIAQIKRDFEKFGIGFAQKKLDVGDYINPENPSVVVDRKQTLSELVGNLGNKKSRFYRECERAIKSGVKLIVLVEHGNGIKTLEDVAEWKNPNPGGNALYMNGRELMERMHTIQVSFGVKFEFCEKRDTAKRIIELLKEEVQS